MVRETYHTDVRSCLIYPSEIITKPEAQAVDPVGKELLNDAITCLSRTIYWESRGDGAAGMEGIANVVMNRLGHEGFPNTICEVVMQGRDQGAFVQQC